MQMKVADFSKLPILLEATVDSCLKEETSDWLSEVKSTTSSLENDYSKTIGNDYGPSRSHKNITDVSIYCTHVQGSK